MAKVLISQRQLSRDTILIETNNALDNSNAHEMVEILTAAQASGCKFIIVEMSHLEFISSAGVGSILGTVESSREMGGDIILCNVSKNVLHVLQVLDLDDYLTIKGDSGQAYQICGISA